MTGGIDVNRLRINRYIMECKFVLISYAALNVIELIDTLWNVNQKMESEILPSKWELIDTLWNVNMQVTSLDEKYRVELIDTLWNVNVNILEKIEALEVEN